MYKILENNLNNFDKNYALGNSRYLIQMCSQAKTSGTKLLEVHGVQKGLDPSLRPEKQHTIPKQGGLERLKWVKVEQDQRGRNLIPSIKLSNNHQTCQRNFQEEPK